jgi:hypothetical protein
MRRVAGPDGRVYTRRVSGPDAKIAKIREKECVCRFPS